SNYSTVGGGSANTNSGLWAVLGGGTGNVNNGYAGVLSGGRYNFCDGVFAVVGGGSDNACITNFGVIAGGIQNTNAGLISVIGGGGNNTNTGYYSTIAGGNGNTAGGEYDNIGGGQNNYSRGINSTIPGGAENQAYGTSSFAAGQHALALHNGAFVWSDTSSGATFYSTSNNQFLVRAAGGVGVNTSNPNGSSLYVVGNQPGGSGSPTVEFDNLSTSPANPALRLLVDGTAPEGALNVTVESFSSGILAEFANAVGYVVVITNDGTIYCKTTVNTSDRNVKQDFVNIDAKTILARVAAMPVTEWSYKDDPCTRHIGPVSQDFRQSFQVGVDDKHIATIDEEGVALAAIKGLDQLLKEKDAEIQALKNRLDRLEQRTH
ncbi:MAG TPA: tail fiber domain-containing protein, partial [Verrucomicrobiae bacterium]|nr:tail fiber domain-containing protein [Verrucomicrobiae bacterium]